MAELNTPPANDDMSFSDKALRLVPDLRPDSEFESNALTAYLRLRSDRKNKSAFKKNPPFFNEEQGLFV